MELAILQTIGTGILAYVDMEPYSQRGLFSANLGGSINIINQLKTESVENFSYANYMREYATAGGFGTISFGISQLSSAAIAKTVLTGKWTVLAAESIFALSIHYIKDTALYMGGYGKSLNAALTSATGNAFVGTPLTIVYQLADRLSPTMRTIVQNSIGFVGNGWAILNGKYDITGKIRNAFRGGKDSSSDSGIGLHVSDYSLDTGSTFDFSFKLDYVFDDSDDFDDTTPAITSDGWY